MKSLLKEIKYRAKNKFQFLLSYFESFLAGNIFSRRYKSVQCFCLFVGYGRSGHTLIASLLNAHPDIVIGIEWGLFTYLKLCYTKNQIYYSLIKNANAYGIKKKNIWTGYSYNIDNSWQGKYRTLKVIGDKHGGTNSTKLATDYALLKQTEEKTGIRPKLIHVVRNPFDIITTTTIRRLEVSQPTYKPTSLDLLPYIRLFFEHANVVMRIKSENYFMMFDLFHEEFIKNPKKQLAQLISFLGLKAEEEYLIKCSAIVYQEPKRSRYKIHWPEELKRYVEGEIVKYPFLEQYNYSN
jgi:hypothetical protein